jgi:hypothetical protein
LPQALQHASSALRLDPGHDTAMKLRKRVKDVDRLKEEGNMAFKASRLQDALEKYGEALLVSNPSQFLALAKSRVSSRCDLSASVKRRKKVTAVRSEQHYYPIGQRHS